MKQRRSDNQMLRRFVSSGVTALSDYEIEVIVCTNDDHVLDGDVWDMQGIDLARYLAHPVVLWDHDMSQPIGRASDLTVTPEKITAKVTFPDEGISPKADEIRKMVKSGMISGVSGGILPVQSRPLDPKKSALRQSHHQIDPAGIQHLRRSRRCIIGCDCPIQWRHHRG